MDEFIRLFDLRGLLGDFQNLVFHDPWNHWVFQMVRRADFKPEPLPAIFCNSIEWFIIRFGDNISGLHFVHFITDLCRISKVIGKFFLTDQRFWSRMPDIWVYQLFRQSLLPGFSEIRGCDGSPCFIHKGLREFIRFQFRDRCHIHIGAAIQHSVVTLDSSPQSSL